MHMFTKLCGNALGHSNLAIFLCFIFYVNIASSLLIPSLRAASSSSNEYITPSQLKRYTSTFQPKSSSHTSIFHSSLSQDEIPISKKLNGKVDTLLNLIQETKNNANGETESQYENDIKALVEDIETDSAALNSNKKNEESLSRFQNLIGLYTVDQVITQRKKENPVGGKWTRKNSLTQNLLRSRRTFQHILETSKRISSNTNSTDPIVAEAVNVISFDALFGLFRLTIMLRGDAIPLTSVERKELHLSNYAVRAYFDPPRIVFGKQGRICNINLGPPSNVVLDATHVDDKVRIGKGGISKSRFVFKRCNQEDQLEMAEANEFKALLDRRPLRRSKMTSILLGAFGCSVYSFRLGRYLMGSLLFLFSGIGGIALKFSTGGIEEDEQMRTAQAP